MGVKKEIEQLLKPLAPAAPKPDAAPAPAVKPPKAETHQEKWKGRRTLGNIWAALEAQRVYTGAPSVSKPQAPPANLQGQGTAPAMDQSGPWSQPGQ